MARAVTVDDVRERENRRLLTRLSIVVVIMFGFGFAMVPFYDHICRALGLDSLVAKADEPANTQVDMTRKVSIELDANSHDTAWKFRPVTPYLEIHPGELVHVEYEVSNPGAAPVTGQAVPSYGPKLAGEYFKKLDCFCFTRQTLAAGETRRMPVTFYVDPSLPDDVKTITLSYTFFVVAGMDGKS